MRPPLAADVNRASLRRGSFRQYYLCFGKNGPLSSRRDTCAAATISVVNFQKE